MKMRPGQEMHVVSLQWGVSPGGVAKYAEQLGAVTESAPIRVTQLCILNSGWPVDADALSRMKALCVQIRGRWDLSWLSKVAAILDRLQPDLVMTHGFNAHVVMLALRWLARRRYRVASSYHGEYHPGSRVRRVFAPIFNGATIFFLRHYALGVIAVAEYSKAYLVRHGIPRNRITVIHNGIVDVGPLGGREQLREEWGVPRKGVVIGTACRLDPIKGLGCLLQSMALLMDRYNDSYLVIVGSGPLEQQLREEAARLNIAERVIFTGFRSDVARCLEAFDVFALPSIMEYHSIALLEAMRAGKTIVATAVGGNPESIRDGVEGFLVPPNDGAALAAGLSRVIAEPDLARRLGGAARLRFEAEFTVDKTIDRTARWLLAIGATLLVSDTVRREIREIH